MNYGQRATPTSTEVFPMIVRFEEQIMSAGIRFRFAGHKQEAPAPPPIVPPPPPPPPVVEPATGSAPPAATAAAGAGERGERGL